MVAAGESAWLMWSPQSIQIEVLPGDTRVPAGGPVRIHAVVRVGGRVLTRLEPSLTVSASGSQRTVPMPRRGNEFEFAFESVDRTFTYRVSAGSRASRDFTVSALFPPKVRRIEAHYEYPSFTGLSPRDEEDGGDLYAPEGTRVRLRIHTDKPVESGTMSISDGAKTSPFRKTGTTELEADLLLTKNEAYRVQLTDADGLRGGGETEYFIRLMDDRPPDVRILRPNGDQQITPLEEVAIEARADDDYGIAEFDLVYSVAGRPERTATFSRVAGTNVAKIGARAAVGRGSARPAGRRDHVLRAGARHRQRQATRPRRRATCSSSKSARSTRSSFRRRVRPWPRSGDPQLESLICGAEGNHQRDLEHRASFSRGSIDRRREGRVAGAARASDERSR